MGGDVRWGRRGGGRWEHFRSLGILRNFLQLLENVEVKPDRKGLG